MLIEAMCLSIACVTSFNSDFHGAVDDDFSRLGVIEKPIKFKFKKQKKTLRTLREHLSKYDLKWRLKVKRNTTVTIDLNDPEDVEIAVRYIF